MRSAFLTEPAQGVLLILNFTINGRIGPQYGSSALQIPRQAKSTLA